MDAREPAYVYGTGAPLRRENPLLTRGQKKQPLLAGATGRLKILARKTKFQGPQVPPASKGNPKGLRRGGKGVQRLKKVFPSKSDNHTKVGRVFKNVGPKDQGQHQKRKGDEWPRQKKNPPVPKGLARQPHVVKTQDAAKKKRKKKK